MRRQPLDQFWCKLSSMGRSNSVRLDELPDVVQVLENDPLCTHEEPPTKGSVQITIVGPKHRTERDVSTFDDQCRNEGFLFM